MAAVIKIVAVVVMSVLLQLIVYLGDGAGAIDTKYSVLITLLCTNFIMKGGR